MSVVTFASGGYGETPEVPALMTATALAVAVRIKGSSLIQWAGSTRRTIVRIGQHAGPEKLYVAVYGSTATSIRFRLVTDNSTRLNDTGSIEVATLDPEAYYTLYAHRDTAPPSGAVNALELALYGSTTTPIVATSVTTLSALGADDGGRVLLSRTDSDPGARLTVDGLAVYTRAVPLDERPLASAPIIGTANLACLWAFKEPVDALPTAVADAVAGTVMTLVGATWAPGGTWPPPTDADRLVFDDFTPAASYDVGEFLLADVKAVIGVDGETDPGYSGTARLEWSDAPGVTLVTSAFTDGVAHLAYLLRGTDVGAERQLVVVDDAGALLPTAASDPFAVVVRATEIEVTSAPSVTVAAQTFTVVAQLIDADGNIGTVESGTATITTDIGTLGGETAVAAEAGVVTFADLTLSQAGTASLSVSYPGLTSVEVDVVVAPAGLSRFLLIATAKDAGANVLARSKSWVSSDPEVATVASNGYVEAVGVGTCEVTATSGGVTAACAVEVVQG